MHPFKVAQIVLTIRWIKGYRYLDRCGEALVLLDERLDKGWITGEISPTGGNLRNYRLGLAARFQTEFMTVQQMEFISFEHFAEQTCIIFDTLWPAFEISRLNVPSIRFIAQSSCDSVDEAEAVIERTRLCEPTAELYQLAEGKPSALSFTLCTEDDLTWHGEPTRRRRRVEFHSIQQEKQPEFDPRILQRVPLFSLKDREAIASLLKLRRTMSSISPFAAQADLENTLESEFSTGGLKSEMQ